MNRYFKSFKTAAEEQEWLSSHDYLVIVTYVVETDTMHINMNEAYVGKDLCKPFTIKQLTGSNTYTIQGQHFSSLDDGLTWEENWDRSYTLNANDTLQLRSTFSDRHRCWQGNGQDFNVEDKTDSNTFEISGNICSLIDADYYYKCSCEDRNGRSEELYFYKMFSGDTLHGVEGLVNAEDLILPYNLTREMFYGMFWGCVNLVTPPSYLPAKELKEGCYNYMFSSCTSLQAFPMIKTECVVPDLAYHCTFLGCSSVTTVPTGMNIGVIDYYLNSAQAMFAACDSLTNAPIVKIIGSNDSCHIMFATDYALTDVSGIHIEITGDLTNPFEETFKDCSSLDHFEIYGENWPCFDNSTLEGCAANGTFTVPAVTNYDPNDYIGNGIPSGWTIVRAS